MPVYRNAIHRACSRVHTASVWHGEAGQSKAAQLLLRGHSHHRPVPDSAVRITWLLQGRVPTAHEAENKGTLYYVEKATNHQCQELKLQHPLGAAWSVRWQSSCFSAGTSAFPCCIHSLLPSPDASDLPTFPSRLFSNATFFQEALCTDPVQNFRSKIGYLSFSTCLLGKL